MRKELTFTDLGDAFNKENLSEYFSVKKWCTLPYRTKMYSGNMLVCFHDSHPEDVRFSPNISGWYKIFVALPVLWSEGVENCVQLRLDSDPSFFSLRPSIIPQWDEFLIEETLWRCADMTGEDIILTKDFIADSCNSMLSWIRFVPMSEEEVEAYKRDAENKENKRLYYQDDLHYFLYSNAINNEDDFKSILLPLKDADFVYASIESVDRYDGECPLDISEMSFSRSGDRRIQTHTKALCTDENITKVVNMGHEMGLRMVTSQRLAAWDQSFPTIQCYFDNSFAKAHPELRCVDRDGKKMRSFSYAYPEVRRYAIDQLVNRARLGFDAVQPIFTRRVPFLLFEEPVAKRFYERYGEYPYELPLIDERLNALYCEIMTEFMRELRAALNSEIPERHVEIHARVLFSLYDSKYFGLDVRQWAKEGLVDCIISFPQRLYERLPSKVFSENGRIDIEKYSAYLEDSAEHPVFFDCDFDFLPPYVDCYGNSVGPASQKERIDEFLEIEREFGTKVFFDLMPREMPSDEYERRAKEFYSLGAERISLWDTNTRYWHPAMWDTVKRLGHKSDLLDGKTLSSVTTYHRILSVAGHDETKF